MNAIFAWIAFGIMVFVLPKVYLELDRTQAEERRRTELQFAGAKRLSDVAKQAGIASIDTSASPGDAELPSADYGAIATPLPPSQSERASDDAVSACIAIVIT